jgi:hypothetical protein
LAHQRCTSSIDAKAAGGWKREWNPSIDAKAAGGWKWWWTLDNRRELWWFIRAAIKASLDFFLPRIFTAWMSTYYSGNAACDSAVFAV